MIDKEKAKKRFLNLRIAKKVSQYTLADDLELSRSTVTSWELGTRLPSPEVLGRLADYYDVTIDYLLGQSDKKK